MGYMEKTAIEGADLPIHYQQQKESKIMKRVAINVPLVHRTKQLQRKSNAAMQLYKELQR